MKIMNLAIHICPVIMLLLFFCISFVNAYHMNIEFESRDENELSVNFKYDRIDEVNKQCANILASASEFKPNDNRFYSIKEELSFLNGDWWQEGPIKAPLIPFDDGDFSKSSSSDPPSPLNLVSFWITHVDRAHRYKKSVAINGVLQMGITLDGLFTDKPFDGSPRFDIWPNHTQMSIVFQGIYTESKRNNGERVVCLLGDTMLPSREADSADPWAWMNELGYTNQPPLSQDDQILLVLRYPKTKSLTNREIRGKIKSLNPKSNLKYFDEVQISSWLGKSVNYEFGSKKLVSKACDPYPYRDSFINGGNGIDFYEGLDFCSILERFTHEEGLTVVPNWKCNGTDEFCSKLGPFVSNKEIKSTDGGFKGVKILIQDLHCEISRENAGFGSVSAVFRAIPPLENTFIASHRSGLNNMTISAEGIWKYTSGQLCMVGCLGNLNLDEKMCDSRICLYVPLSFSISQRSVILGSFSSITGSQRSFFPLFFENLVRPSEIWVQYHPHYIYSKLDLAATVLEKSKPFDFSTIIKKSFLKFPKIEDSDSFMSSLSVLSEDLTLHSSSFPDRLTDIQIEILSLGPLFGRFSSLKDEIPFHPAEQSTEKQLLLNVSAQMFLGGKQFDNFSTLLVEGFYDPLVGKMYLIGCRDVRASWKILYESMDLENGLDCLVEGIVAYPPITSRWMADPTAEISISSRRSEDDPLYFRPINLKTLPIMYRKQRENILSRRGVESILRVLTLSMAITCITSQLLYIRDNLESVPYISLVMIGVQAIGYALNLIAGFESLFRKINFAYDLDSNQWIRIVDYIVKLLVLVAFSITMRIGQKIWKSRRRLISKIPSEKRVILVTFAIHLIGFFSIFLVFRFMGTKQKPGENSHTIRRWDTDLEQYVGLVQDLFLIPQLIGNIIWKIECKPLRNLYYLGIMAIRIIPHVYDYLRSPVSNPYFSDEYEFVNPNLDFYSKSGDIAIPGLAVVLAIGVYVQQRWGYEKLSQTLLRFKVVLFGHKVYERLPETELASGGGDSEKNDGKEENGGE